jgi:hypothetical protein
MKQLKRQASASKEEYGRQEAAAASKAKAASELTQVSDSVLEAESAVPSLAAAKAVAVRARLRGSRFQLLALVEVLVLVPIVALHVSTIAHHVNVIMVTTRPAWVILRTVVA